MNWLFPAMIFALVGLGAGCGTSDVCSDDSDCFSGEACVEGTCTVAGENGATNSNPNADGGNSGNAGNSGNTGNGSTPNATTVNSVPNGATNAMPNNNSGSSCFVDPFTATCDDDDYEENDEIGDEVIPLDQSSWCAGETLRTDASFSGKFCAGDGLDLYRLLIDNRGPVCITEDFTIKIEVVIEQSCNSSLIDVIPYTFFDNPNRVNLCADSDDVRCTSFEEGRRRVIEWRRPVEQMPDVNLLVGSDEDNVQFDYQVNITLIP